MKDKTYDLLSPTSMGIRMTPLNSQPIHTSDHYLMRASSAETNVLSIGSALGLNVKVLTKFVKSSPISTFIKNDLGKRHIYFEGPEIDQQGPWGYRHQFNIADSGYGLRGPRVHNDRAGEVGLTMTSKDYDLEKLLVQEGSKIVHISGLIAALSEQTAQLCLDIVKMAKKQGSLISFDLNYRASFWEGRAAFLKDIFHKIALSSDILIGNEEDFQLCLNINGPKEGGKDILNQLDSFKEMIASIKLKYPNANVVATTLREVEQANQHLWGAIVYQDEHWTFINPRPIQVLDRIGGGDGFVGGLLYGIIKKFTPEKTAQFAWSTGVLAATVIEDYAIPQDEAQIWNIWEGNARVMR